MNLGELVTTIRDTLTAQRVYGEPVERDGVVIVPAGVVFGGGGGGAGHVGGQAQDGGGFGLVSRPTGAFVIRNGVVRWVPAVDVNRIVAMVGVVLAVHLVTRRRG
jgi:uncharacterized spore protein YtfJ